MIRTPYAAAEGHAFVTGSDDQGLVHFQEVAGLKELTLPVSVTGKVTVQPHRERSIEEVRALLNEEYPMEFAGCSLSMAAEDTTM